MQDEGIEAAIFIAESLELPAARFPVSYAKFCESWAPIAEEYQKRELSESVSATEEPQDTQDIPLDVDKVLSDLLKTFEEITMKYATGSSSNGKAVEPKQRIQSPE